MQTTPPTQKASAEPEIRVIHRGQLHIERLAHAEHAGDWHDKPLRWQVVGAELQKFSTKKEAAQWASCRRRARTFNETYSLWMAIS